MGLVLGLCVCEGDNKLGIGSVCQIHSCASLEKLNPIIKFPYYGSSS